ncbi:MAG: putative lipid II flippase FtsW [Halioglobus sp.]|nr:putative lipid II flippase FtsW [Halioglobus sp.]
MSRADALPTLPDASMTLLGLALLLVGLVAISSASIDYSQFHDQNAWYHTQRHLIYLVAAVGIGIGLYQVPMSFWQETGWMWLLLALAGLILVLIPGLGKEVNGSQRWIAIGPYTAQPSEFAKLAMVVYLAGYMVRRETELRRDWRGFLKPMGVLGATTLLLLVEPDFGATVIVVATAMGMLFLAGVKLGHFLIVALGAFGAAVVLVLSAPYRWERVKSFRNPWDDPYGSNFQLVQSLIAYGRGEWSGVGLGNSVQKLFYLPEAHTDFVFSVWAEETGFIGAVTVIVLFVALIGCILWTARRAALVGDTFAAHICHGVALVFSGQAFVNIGMSSGLLPTKGLTLPFVSYGGTSLIVCCAMLALVLRVERENRLARPAGRRK